MNQPTQIAKAMTPIMMMSMLMKMMTPMMLACSKGYQSKASDVVSLTHEAIRDEQEAIDHYDKMVTAAESADLPRFAELIKTIRLDEIRHRDALKAMLECRLI